MLEITPITRVVVSIDVAGTLADKTPAVIAAVDVGFVPPRSAPGGTTAFVASSYSAGKARVMLVGYDADPTSALVCPGGEGADLWILVTDGVTGEVIPARVMRVIVQPSSADALVAASPTAGLDALIAALIATPGSAVRNAVLDLPTYPTGA